MIKRLFLLFFMINLFQLKAQPIMDYAYQQLYGAPIGFFKNNTFTHLYSDNGSSTQILALNPNKTVRFNQSVQIGHPGILVYHSTRFCSPAPDKGLLTSDFVSFKYSFAQSATLYSSVYYSKVDSLGATLFSKAGGRGGVGAVSNTFYYEADFAGLYRINTQSGLITNTVYSAPSNIIRTAVNPKQQIVVTTSVNINVIDTNGIVIVNWSGNGNYSKIKPYKKHYYFLDNTRTVMEQRDSLLNVLATFTVDGNSTINDYSLYNDTLYTAVSNTLIGRSIISSYSTLSLTPIVSNTISIAQHDVIGLVKDTLYNFLIAERIGYFYQGVYASYASSKPNYNSGYSSFYSLNSINYPNDLIIKRIKTQSFNLSSNYSFASANSSSLICNYSYQHSIVLYNNSSNTVKRFRVFHPHNRGNYNKFDLTNYTYVKDTTLTINPNDSIELAMPSFSETIQFPQAITNVSIELCYNVLLPNQCLDNNPIDNSICINEVTYDVSINTYSKAIHELKISPNPANDHLFIETNESIRSYIIYDLSGRNVLDGNETKEIDVSKLKPGLYFIYFTTKEKLVTKKFVKED